MLYKLAHILRDKFPWMWNLIEWLNGLFFVLRYAKKIGRINDILVNHQLDYKVMKVDETISKDLSVFFAEQPENDYVFFRPHKFDEKTLRKLTRNKSFLSFVVMKENKIVGYFFLRCFFIGKCYRGYMTDYRWRRKGINRLMGEVSTEIAVSLGIPMYGSINKKNIASMKSVEAVNIIRIIEELSNGDMIVEYLPRRDNNR